jgi:hypothetical protein
MATYGPKRYKPDGLGGSGSGGDLVSIDRLQAAIASVGRVRLPLVAAAL